MGEPRMEAELSNLSSAVIVDVTRSSPDPDPQSSADVQHHQYSAASSAATSPSRPTARARTLQSIKESTPHSLMLQKLQRSEKRHQKDAIRQKRAVRRLSKDMYQVLSIYALLQGALFAAVAQTTIFTCEDWWGPAFISGAVTVGTLMGVLDRLRRIGQCKQEARCFERRQNAVNDRIQELHFFGSSCSLEFLEPAYVPDSCTRPHCVFSVHGLVVLLFLLGFSCLIIMCCIYMLCRSCTCR